MLIHNGCPHVHTWTYEIRVVNVGLTGSIWAQRCRWGALEYEGRQAKLRFKLIEYTHTRGSDLTPPLVRHRYDVAVT